MSSLATESYPVAGSRDENQRFKQIQKALAPLFQRVFPDARAPRTVIVLPSLSLDAAELAKISGVNHYEERLLCMLMLLRMPYTQIIYLTSQPVDPAIIDYYLHLLPGIPSQHARRRLTLLHCHDASLVPLTQKIIERPRLLQRLKAAVANPEAVHITCFNAGPLERTLSVRLGVPLYACDPDLNYLGSKSGSREVFREAGVQVPPGFEQLRDEKDISESLIELKSTYPDLRRAVVKLNEGFSGEGNAVFSFQDFDSASDLRQWVNQHLATGLKFEAQQETWEKFRAKFAEMGGIVESFIEGDEVRSPSVQCRINPLGQVNLVSTHEQVLGGPSGQIFLGCTFPADKAYRQTIQQAGLDIAEVLRERSVLGRFGIDFISVRKGDEWHSYAIETNLRKGGTTHTFMMLQFLTDGSYDSEEGIYLTPGGQPRYYYATDNLQSEAYRGLTPTDLIDIAVDHGLHFHGATQQGVVFHLIGALSEFGKIGMVCVADSRERAQAFYDETIAVLDRETAESP